MLASRSWRARVATTLLLRELRLFPSLEIPAPDPTAATGRRRRARGFLDHLRTAIGLTTADRSGARPTLAAEGVASPDPASTLPRRPLAEGRRAYHAASVAERAAADAEMHVVDALLSHLDADARELEIALRVVRRVRSLVGTRR